MKFRATTTLVASLVVIGHSTFAADLDITTVNGTSAVLVPAGGTVRARVSLDASSGTLYNAALFRIVFTEERCTLLDYTWQPPFVTGSVNDYSLDGAALPLQVMDDTLEGPAYPIDTADIEFGVFDFTQYAQAGLVMSLDFAVPAKLPVGSIFVVAALPDDFSAGFVSLPVTAGSALIVQIGPPAPFGDLDGDYAIGAADLAILLSQWNSDGTADLDGDGEVSASDLSLLLFAWTE
jgi:hypothetical protein